MEPGEPSRGMMVCRFGYACVGIILGLAVFICFLAAPDFYNLHISLWGFASALFAFLTLLVHIQHVKGNRDVWVYRLKPFILLGFFTAIGCIIAFVVYLAIAIAEKQDLLPVNGNERQKGYYLASIWVFMTWKWSFALFLTSRAYRRTYTTRYVAIP